MRYCVIAAGFAGHDTPRAVFFDVDVRGDSTGAVHSQGDMPVWCVWSDSAENFGFSAAAVLRRSSISLSWCRGRFPRSSCSEDHRDSAVAVCFLVVDAPVVQVLFHAVLCSTGAHGSDPAEIRVDAAGAVPAVVDVAVLRSDTLSRDSEGATDSVHRRSQWTFLSPQRHVRTVASVHGWRR